MLKTCLRSWELGKLPQDKFVYRTDLMETQYGATEKPWLEHTRHGDRWKQNWSRGPIWRTWMRDYTGPYIRMHHINKKSTGILDQAPIFVGRSTYLLDLHPLFWWKILWYPRFRCFVCQEEGTLGFHRRRFSLSGALNIVLLCLWFRVMQVILCTLTSEVWASCS